MTANELRAWRQKRGLTQSEAAHLLGVLENTYRRYECAIRPIPFIVTRMIDVLEAKDCPNSK